MKIRKVKYLWDWHYCIKVGVNWYVWPEVETGQWTMYKDGNELSNYEQRQNKITLMTCDEVKKFLSDLDAMILLGQLNPEDYKLRYISALTLCDTTPYTNNMFGIAWPFILSEAAEKKWISTTSMTIWKFICKQDTNKLVNLWIERRNMSWTTYASTWYIVWEDCAILAKIWKPSALQKLSKAEAEKVKNRKSKHFKTDEALKDKKKYILDIWYWSAWDKDSPQPEPLPFKGELAQRETDWDILTIWKTNFTYDWLKKLLLDWMHEHKWECFLWLILQQTFNNLRQKFQWSLYINQSWDTLSYIALDWSISFQIPEASWYLYQKVDLETNIGNTLAINLVSIVASYLFYYCK